MDDIQQRIVIVTPNSDGAKQLVQERQKVKEWNESAVKTNELNKRLGGTKDVIPSKEK